MCYQADERTSGMKTVKGLILSALLILLFLATSANAQYLSFQDILGLPPVLPDTAISYGSDSLQFGELRIPDGPGPHPVAIVIHGGCFLSFINLDIMDHFCDELTSAGIATWNLEYRRVDNPGGGWPVRRDRPKFCVEVGNCVPARLGGSNMGER